MCRLPLFFSQEILPNTLFFILNKLFITRHNRSLWSYYKLYSLTKLQVGRNGQLLVGDDTMVLKHTRPIADEQEARTDSGRPLLTHAVSQKFGRRLSHPYSYTFTFTATAPAAILQL